MSKFNEAFIRLMRHECVHTPGEVKKFGLLRAKYPNIDFDSLTMNAAGVVIRMEYWEPLRLEELPDELAFQLMDAAVAHGVDVAIRSFQLSVDATTTDVMDDETIKQANTKSQLLTIAHLNGWRLHHCLSIKQVDENLVRRVANNLLET